MIQQTLSIASHSEEVQRFLADRLAEFDGQNRSQTALQPIGWGDLWSKLRNVALTRGGIDVSQIGTTWIESFVGMKALRPFAPREVFRCGNPENHFPSVWKSVTILNDSHIWAVPWLADTRIIYYWRDMLEAAGVDEATAFQTFENLENTLERLQASGIAAPWIAPGDGRVGVSLYQAASWIWGMGGDFVSADGRSTAFCEPEALNGIAAYFNLLLNNVTQANKSMDVVEIHRQFTDRRFATMISGPWYIISMRQGDTTDDVYANLGVALPPGPAFIGGSNLVIWRHIPMRVEKTALALVEFLTSPEIERECSLMTGMMPARLDVLNEPPFSTDPHYRVFVEALKYGRSLPAIPLWGVVEENLVAAFGMIWERILENRDQSVERIIVEQLEPLAHRLDRTLGQE